MTDKPSTLGEPHGWTLEDVAAIRADVNAQLDRVRDEILGGVDDRVVAVVWHACGGSHFVRGVHGPEALGWRRHFVASSGTDDYAACERAVALGYMSPGTAFVDWTTTGEARAPIARYVATDAGLELARWFALRGGDQAKEVRP